MIGRPELANDPRFADHVSLLEHSADAIEILTEVFAERPLAEWRERLETFSGQWTVVQDTLEVADDPQTVANGYIQDCETADRHAVPAGRGAGAIRRGARRYRSERPSSTSTATPSSPTSGSTGTPSST